MGERLRKRLLMNTTTTTSPNQTEKVQLVDLNKYKPEIVRIQQQHGRIFENGHMWEEGPPSAAHQLTPSSSSTSTPTEVAMASTSTAQASKASTSTDVAGATTSASLTNTPPPEHDRVICTGARRRKGILKYRDVDDDGSSSISITIPPPEQLEPEDEDEDSEPTQPTTTTKRAKRRREVSFTEEPSRVRFYHSPQLWLKKIRRSKKVLAFKQRHAQMMMHLTTTNNRNELALSTTTVESSRPETQQLDPSDLHPLCPELVDCTDSIEPLLTKLTPDPFLHVLRQDFSRNGIRTIGDLSRMGPEGIKSFLIRSPRKETTKRALREYFMRKTVVKAESPGSLDALKLESPTTESQTRKRKLKRRSPKLTLRKGKSRQRDRHRLRFTKNYSGPLPTISMEKLTLKLSIPLERLTKFQIEKYASGKKLESSSEHESQDKNQNSTTLNEVKSVSKTRSTSASRKNRSKLPPKVEVSNRDESNGIQHETKPPDAIKVEEGNPSLKATSLMKGQGLSKNRNRRRRSATEPVPLAAKSPASLNSTVLKAEPLSCEEMKVESKEDGLVSTSVTTSQRQLRKRTKSVAEQSQMASDGSRSSSQISCTQSQQHGDSSTKLLATEEIKIESNQKVEYKRKLRKSSIESSTSLEQSILPCSLQSSVPVSPSFSSNLNSSGSSPDKSSPRRRRKRQFWQRRTNENYVRRKRKPKRLAADSGVGTERHASNTRPASIETIKQEDVLKSTEMILKTEEDAGDDKIKVESVEETTTTTKKQGHTDKEVPSTSLINQVRAATKSSKTPLLPPSPEKLVKKPSSSSSTTEAKSSSSSSQKPSSSKTTSKSKLSFQKPKSLLSLICYFLQDTEDVANAIRSLLSIRSIGDKFLMELASLTDYAERYAGVVKQIGLLDNELSRQEEGLEDEVKVEIKEEEEEVETKKEEQVIQNKGQGEGLNEETQEEIQEKEENVEEIKLDDDVMQGKDEGENQVLREPCSSSSIQEQHALSPEVKEEQVIDKIDRIEDNELKAEEEVEEESSQSLGRFEEQSQQLSTCLDLVPVSSSSSSTPSSSSSSSSSISPFLHLLNSLTNINNDTQPHNHNEVEFKAKLLDMARFCLHSLGISETNNLLQQMHDQTNTTNSISTTATTTNNNPP